MGEMNSFQDAFYIMAKELGFDYAQPLSPREVFETQMLPRIKELVATQPAAGEPDAPKPIGYISEQVRQELLHGKHVPANICTATPSRRNPHPGPDTNWSVPIFAAPPAAAHGEETPDTVRVTADWLKMVRRDLDACQKVIWLAGCRPRVPGGFDPAYCEDAKARLKEIDEQIARALSNGKVK